MFNLSDGLTAIIQLDQATIKSRDHTQLRERPRSSSFQSQELL